MLHNNEIQVFHFNEQLAFGRVGSPLQIEWCDPYASQTTALSVGHM